MSLKPFYVCVMKKAGKKCHAHRNECFLSSSYIYICLEPFVLVLTMMVITKLCMCKVACVLGSSFMVSIFT